MPDRPHLSWPVQFAPGGGYVMVEQDSADDVASCMGTILSWPLGTRPGDPNFGVAEQAFLQGGANLDEIKQAVLQSEPRAADLVTMQDDSLLADFIAGVQVGFTVGQVTG